MTKFCEFCSYSADSGITSQWKSYLDVAPPADRGEYKKILLYEQVKFTPRVFAKPNSSYHFSYSQWIVFAGRCTKAFCIVFLLTYSCKLLMTSPDLTQMDQPFHMTSSSASFQIIHNDYKAWSPQPCLWTSISDAELLTGWAWQLLWDLQLSLLELSVTEQFSAALIGIIFLSPSSTYKSCLGNCVLDLVLK